MVRRTVQWLLVFALLFASVIPNLSLAADTPDAPAKEASTTSDAAVDVARLQIMLRPMTLDEVKVEVEGWMALLKVKVQEIANAELGVKAKKDEIDKAEKKADDADEKVDDAKKEADDAKKDGDAKQPVVNPTKDDVDDTKKKVDDANKKVDDTKRKADVEKQKAEAEAEVKEAEKVNLLEGINALRDQQSKIIDRTRVVLAAYAEKGGEIESYEMYINAVAGSAIDVTDASSFWISIKGWIGSEEGGLRWGKNLIFFILVIFASWIVSRFVGRLVEKAVNRTKRLSTLLREFVVGIVRRVIFLVGCIVALSMLEVDIGPMLAAIGAIGFVVAFALQETLGNFASGVMILLYRPFDVGDSIDAGGVKGKVKRLTLVSTTMTTPDNQLVIVPNNKIWGNVITNVTGSATRRVDLVFGISYDDDMGKAAEIMDRLVAQHELVLDDPAPVIKVHELADSSVNFVCRPWVNTSDYWNVYWDLTRQVKEAFDKEGVSIPYPHQDVYLHRVDDTPEPTTQTDALTNKDSANMPIDQLDERDDD